MDTLRTLAILLPLSLTSGIDLYATVLTAGVLMRTGVLQNVPASLAVLASWPVIIVAAIFFLADFFADKIPFVDNLWDIIHTVIRPCGAAILGATALGEVNPTVAVVGALVAGGIALTSHAGKAGTRAMLNIMSPLENVTNIAVSIGEDVFVIGLTALAFTHPYLTAAIALVILLALIVTIPLLFSWMFFTIRSVFSWMRHLGHRLTNHTIPSDILPTSHMKLLGHRLPTIASRAKAVNVKGVGGRTGYVSLNNSSLSFTYTGWWKSNLWSVYREQIVASYHIRKTLSEILEIHYKDDDRKERVVRFAFLKDRSSLAHMIASMLGAMNASR
jgi:hypothetical protein